MTLRDLGLAAKDLSSAWKRGSTLKVRLDADPYLVNICDDPLLSGCVTYVLPEDEPVKVGSDPSCTIQVEGLRIRSEMCEILNHDGVTVVLVVLDGDTGNPDGPPKGSLRRTAIFDSMNSVNSLLVPGILKNDGNSAKQARRSYRGRSMVYVNNTVVTKQHTLHDGDSLRIGPTHVFQVFIPQAAAQKPPEDAQHDVASIIKSITRDGTFERTNAKQFAAHMKERVGGKRTEKMLHQLQELLPLVEEANVMTEELREDGDYEFVFKPQVLTNVLSAEQGDIAVSLCRVKKPDDVDARGNPVYSDKEGPVADIIVIWTKQRFLARLEAMRDLLSDVTERDVPWGLPGDQNPWEDIDTIPAFGLPTVFGGPLDDDREVEAMNEMVRRRSRGMGDSSVPGPPKQVRIMEGSATIPESVAPTPEAAKPPDAEKESLLTSFATEKELTDTEKVETTKEVDSPGVSASPCVVTSVTALHAETTSTTTASGSTVELQLHEPTRTAVSACADLVLPREVQADCPATTESTSAKLAVLENVPADRPPKTPEAVLGQTSGGLMSSCRSWSRNTSPASRPTHWQFGGRPYALGNAGTTQQSATEWPLLGLTRSACSLIAQPRGPCRSATPPHARSVSPPPCYVSYRQASSSPCAVSPCRSRCSSRSPCSRPSFPNCRSLDGSLRSVPFSGTGGCGDVWPVCGSDTPTPSTRSPPPRWHATSGPLRQTEDLRSPVTVRAPKDSVSLPTKWRPWTRELPRRGRTMASSPEQVF